MTFLQTYTRFLYLIGESDITTISAIHKSHINAIIKDICNAYPFSWNLKTADLTLSSGTADLPADYNANFHLRDARISVSSTNDDSIFTEIPIEKRDAYTTDDYVFWITYDTSTETYIFNTPTQSGTVTIYYNFVPADLTSDADVCVVPDGEAVAYGAASKNWIGDERNTGLKNEYEQESVARITAMQAKDLVYGGQYSVNSAVSMNPALSGGSDDGLRIAKP